MFRRVPVRVGSCVGLKRPAFHQFDTGLRPRRGKVSFATETEAVHRNVDSGFVGRVFTVPRSVDLLARTVGDLLRYVEGWSLGDFQLAAALVSRVQRAAELRAQGIDEPVLSQVLAVRGAHPPEQSGVEEGLRRVNNVVELEELRHFGRVSHAAYCETADELGSRLQELGLKVVKARMAPGYSSMQPVHFVALDEERREVVVAVRGMWSLAEVLATAIVSPHAWRGGWVHRGMLSSAEALVDRVERDIRELKTAEARSYAVVMTGHSLGAGVASMATRMLRERSIDASAFCFAAPACVSENLAVEMEPYVKTIVHGDDFVPRIHLRGLERLRADLAGEPWVSELWRRLRWRSEEVEEKRGNFEGVSTEDKQENFEGVSSPPENIENKPSNFEEVSPPQNIEDKPANFEGVSPPENIQGFQKVSPPKYIQDVEVASPSKHIQNTETSPPQITHETSHPPENDLEATKLRWDAQQHARRDILESLESAKQHPPSKDSLRVLLERTSQRLAALDRDFLGVVRNALPWLMQTDSAKQVLESASNLSERTIQVWNSIYNSTSPKPRASETPKPSTLGLLLQAAKLPTSSVSKEKQKELDAWRGGPTWTEQSSSSSSSSKSQPDPTGGDVFGVFARALGSFRHRGSTPSQPSSPPPQQKRVSMMPAFQFVPPGRIVLVRYWSDADRSTIPDPESGIHAPTVAKAEVLELPRRDTLPPSFDPREPIVDTSSWGFSSEAHAQLLGHMRLSETMLADHFSSSIERSLDAILEREN